MDIVQVNFKIAYGNQYGWGDALWSLPKVFVVVRGLSRLSIEIVPVFAPVAPQK
jgi:hypothetical protein